MERTVSDPLVDDYLRRLDAAAAGLSPDRREDLLSGIREHIDEAIASGEAGDAASLHDLLDRLGEPEEIVAEVSELVANGYPEIVLTGVHLGHYGIDRSKGKPKAEWRRLWHLLDILDRPFEIVHRIDKHLPCAMRPN